MRVQVPESSSTEGAPARLGWFNGEGTETGILEIFLHLIRNQKKNLRCEKSVHCAQEHLAKVAQVQLVTWVCRSGVSFSYI